MKRVLLQTVGTGRKPNSTGDPGNPVWEALAFVVQKRQPDVLVQLCSDKTKRETIPLFKCALPSKCHPQDMRLECSDDPDDIEQLSIQYSKIIDDLRQDFPDALIEADFTSGTKAMSSALVAAAVARRIPYLHYAIGPRDKGGRASKTDHVVTLNSQQLIADRLLRELGRLFNLGQFVAVKEQAESLANDIKEDSLKERAQSLVFLSEVYDSWMRFDWKSAYTKLREYPKQSCLALAKWDVDLFGRQVGFLKKASKQSQGTPPTPERLVDLYANAKRCIRQERHDDAVARLYRLVEYIGQARLCEFGITRTQNVDIDKLSEMAPDYTKEHLEEKSYEKKVTLNPSATELLLDDQAELERKSYKKKVNLGLRDNIAVLCEAKDPVGKFMAERYGLENQDDTSQYGGPLKQQLDARNNSLLAHGTKTVEKEVAEALRISVADILKKHLDQMHADSKTQKFDDLQDTATFARCPWVEAE